MNLGGEPERDDFGLPPVDIEIPDDARELDRDVQAYHREQRALRRHRRRLRFHAPFTKDGVVLPLLASCLVLALIAGTLLTVFTAGPGDGPLGTGGLRPSSSASSVAGRGPVAPADSPTAAPGARLPSATIQIDGSPVRLSALTAAVIALVPAGCDCSASVLRLVRQASAAGLTTYLVAGPGQLTATRVLATQAGPGQRAVAAYDSSGMLDKSYITQKSGRAAGLTALLIKSDGAVQVAALAAFPGFVLSAQLRALNGQQAIAPGSTAPGSTAPGSTGPRSTAPGSSGTPSARAPLTAAPAPAASAS